MAVLSEILSLLDKWPTWKRMTEAPARVDELEKRLAALEKAPAEISGDPCLFCGKPAMRLAKQEERRLGRMLVGFTETWTCTECGQSKQVAKNV